VDILRLGPDDDLTEVTAGQIRELINRLRQAGQWSAGDPLVLIVLDAGYDLPRLSWLVSDLPVHLLGRIRSNRVLYAPPRAATRDQARPSVPPRPQVRPRRRGHASPTRAGNHQHAGRLPARLRRARCRPHVGPQPAQPARPQRSVLCGLRRTTGLHGQPRQGPLETAHRPSRPETARRRQHQPARPRRVPRPADRPGLHRHPPIHPRRLGSTARTLTLAQPYQGTSGGRRACARAYDGVASHEDL
jgi:hypothetical protein